MFFISIASREISEGQLHHDRRVSNGDNLNLDVMNIPLALGYTPKSHEKVLLRERILIKRMVFLIGMIIMLVKQHANSEHYYQV